LYVNTLRVVQAEKGQTAQVNSSGKSGSADSHAGGLVKQFLTNSAVVACVTYTLTCYGDSLSTLSIHILYGE